ncbi:MAG: SRPBCC family protein [Deinococcota bacterium]
MKQLRVLRAALSANAIFSFMCGITLVIAPARVATWLGGAPSIVLRVIGIGLVVFAFDLIHQASRKRLATWRALYASAADYLWVLATLILLAFFPNALSAQGQDLVLFIALCVFVFGSWQLLGIRRAHKTPAGDYRHCVSVIVRASQNAMWEVVARLGDIQNYAPGLGKSIIEGGEVAEVGVVRTCTNQAGKQWSEACTSVDEGRSFSVRFLADAPDFPFPVHNMIGGWELTPVDEGTQVNIWWELTPKPRVLAAVIMPILAFQMDQTMPAVVERMARAALKEQEIVTPSQNIISKALGQFC